MNNRERRKSTRRLYKAISKARQERSFHTVAGMDITTKEAARLAKATRQSSRINIWKAHAQRLEEDFYARWPD